MDKTIGYKELSVPVKGGEPILIPLKFGLLAIEQYCDYAGVDVDKVVEATMGAFKKKPISVYTNIVRAGANCFQIIEGEGKEYSFREAYSWIESLGLGSTQIIDAFQLFLSSILPPAADELSDEPDEFDRAKKKKRSVSTR